MNVSGSALRLGDWVRFDGDDHQVVGLNGTAVRLRCSAGAEQVLLIGYLLGASDFCVAGTDRISEVEPFGLLDSLPDDVLATARCWERHVVEVETGLPPDAPPDATPKVEYDPMRHGLAERQRAKAAELGVSYRTIEGRRSRYLAHGLWGLVDRRAVRAWAVTGRADARLVERFARFSPRRRTHRPVLGHG
ncbi:helix-turn-helix domain containing protein [Actinoplanes sp. NBC_00393]|uniref:helix-turn-helix domain-containing protein n=1 Tax=Actinoplanes sp. NBC_00393 TaxID=2975953 RepID=UPI002E1DFD4F